MFKNFVKLFAIMIVVFGSLYVTTANATYPVLSIVWS